MQGTGDTFYQLIKTDLFCLIWAVLAHYISPFVTTWIGQLVQQGRKQY